MKTKHKYDPIAKEVKNMPYMVHPCSFHGLQHTKLQALPALGINSNI